MNLKEATIGRKIEPYENFFHFLLSLFKDISLTISLSSVCGKAKAFSSFTVGLILSV